MSKPMTVVTYRDVVDDGHDKTWDIQDLSDGLVIKKMLIPGLFGAKDIHVNHYPIEGVCLLITYTYHELDKDQLDGLIATAIHKVDLHKTSQN